MRRHLGPLGNDVHPVGPAELLHGDLEQARPFDTPVEQTEPHVRQASSENEARQTTAAAQVENRG